MTISEAVGSLGVAILLIAFNLSTNGKMSCHSRTFHAMNLVGASLSCMASAMIGFLPFVLLEASWALVAFVALARGLVEAARTVQGAAVQGAVQLSPVAVR